MAHVGCPACGKTVADTDATCKWCNADIAASRQAAVAAAAIDELSLVQTMSDAQRQLFYAEMAQHRKEKGVARILALLLGGVGGQFFYLRSYAAGAVCILFCWTWIPAIWGIIDLFLVGPRVDRFNIKQAQLVAARIRMTAQASAPPPIPVPQA